MTMIKTVDDLRAQRALAHNDLEVAKSKLKDDTDTWLGETEPVRRATFFMGDLFKNRYQGLAAKGIQAGITAVLGKTVLKKLPTPLNFVVPHMLNNAIVNFTHRHGEKWLIMGLRWLKDVTEEKPEEYEGGYEYTTTAVVPATDADAVTPQTMIPS
ncbi:hypothetical protein [Telluribacter sp.]|jgi:hypothetical protein|uniref:hypothetical protein n=1 Tax=Telluribacter sp. TaxID=1978767 RepID=UPI002E1456FC|nr:hypothetical protein [Telluribacter sp.]